MRLLNGSDSRFLDLWLTPVNGSGTTSTPAFVQIGADTALFDAPVTLGRLPLAPAERADLIIDFSGFAGQTLIMHNDALAVGEPIDPNTVGQIMAFRVNQQNQGGNSPTVPANLRPVYGPIQPFPAPSNTRQLILAEGTDSLGRIQPSLGTVADGKQGWTEPVTENPVINEVEVWEIYSI